MEILENREISQITALYGIEENIPGLVLFNSSKEKISTVMGRPFRSNHYAVVIVSKGSLLMRVNLFTYQLEPGYVMLMAPSAIKEFIAVDDEIDLFVMVFSPELLHSSGYYKTHVSHFDFLTTIKHQILKAGPAALDYLFNLRNMLNIKVADRGSSSYRQSCELLFYLFLLQLGDIHEGQHSGIPPKEIDRKSFLCSQFMQLLSTAVKTHKDVQFYADQLHVNSKYLSQVLKEKTGKSASKHIVEMVVLNAKVLLNDPGNSVADVAFKIGFTDQFNFSKYFKKSTGCTPSSYRAGSPGHSK